MRPTFYVPFFIKFHRYDIADGQIFYEQGRCQ